MRIGWVIATLTLVLGLYMTGRSVHNVSAQKSQIQRKANDLMNLRGLEIKNRVYESALQTFEKIPQKHPRPIRQLLRQFLPGEKAEVRSHKTEPLSKGWKIRQVEVYFPDITLQQLDGFLYEVEAQKPPWRAQTLTVQASETSSGSGQITIVLEALEQEIKS
ncbi:MAG: hypothetical protein GKR87_15710 [Kiritimatiellae bacterium]|nr:hypothetical protein [Kiritimatiellia bacterium]